MILQLHSCHMHFNMGCMRIIYIYFVDVVKQAKTKIFRLHSRHTQSIDILADTYMSFHFERLFLFI